MVFDLLSTINQECSFTDKINNTPFTESIISKNSSINNNKSPISNNNNKSPISNNNNKSPISNNNNKSPISNNSSINNNNNNKSSISKSIIECILSKYDNYYQFLPQNEKSFYMKKKIIEISSLIEEQPTKYYNNYNFNPKIMKLSIIQLGFQLNDKLINHISSIYYLNEFYQKHFIIIYKDKFYETCPKNYPKDYILSINHDEVYERNKERFDNMECFKKYKSYTNTNNIPTFCR